MELRAQSQNWNFNSQNGRRPARSHFNRKWNYSQSSVQCAPPTIDQCAKCDIWLRRQSIWQIKVLATIHRGLVTGQRWQMQATISANPPFCLFMLQTQMGLMFAKPITCLPNWLLDYNCANKWYFWLKFILQIKSDFSQQSKYLKGLSGA